MINKIVILLNVIDHSCDIEQSGVANLYYIWKKFKH